jgi:hypothetical protein
MTDTFTAPFSQASLQRAVERVVAESVPAGKHGALVATMTSAGARVAVAARIGDHWQVVGVLEKKHDGPIEGAGSVIATW